MKKLFNKQTAAIALTFLLFLLTAHASRVLAQTPDEAAPADTAQGNQDANWVTALGLTPDQVAKIRAIRQENKVEWQAARQRLNQAQRALDEAIYSDDASETLVEQRTREVAAAQANEVRLRARTELGIRRVLTPQQLGTFRMIRQQRIREAQMKRRMENGNEQRPLRNRRLENGINLSTPRDRALEQTGGDRKQGGRNVNPALGPRQRRDGLPRRIRP
jgi:Spy/CpxP family protein refolding chaperone